MSTPERLIPVTSERELRVGMIVVIKGCKCGDHRVILLGYGPDNTAPPHAGCGGINGWRYEPKAHDAYSLCFCLGIPEGRIYRVDDGLENDEVQARERLLLSKQAQLLAARRRAQAEQAKERR